MACMKKDYAGFAESQCFPLIAAESMARERRGMSVSCQELCPVTPWIRRHTRLFDSMSMLHQPALPVPTNGSRRHAIFIAVVNRRTRRWGRRGTCLADNIASKVLPSQRDDDV